MAKSSKVKNAAKLLGAKGGKARAKKLSKAQRSAIARQGGLARHGKTTSQPDQPIDQP